jgi:hypothetical protein
MPKATPFLGTTTDRNAAFPDIRSLSVRVVQDPYGMYCREPWQRESSYSKANIPRYERCRNPRCQQGGVDLQQIVWFSGEGEHKFYCSGHEGTPKGRRKGDPCDNSFTITVSIEKE